MKRSSLDQVTVFDPPLSLHQVRSPSSAAVKLFDDLLMEFVQGRSKSKKRRDTGAPIPVPLGHKTKRPQTGPEYEEWSLLDGKIGIGATIDVLRIEEAEYGVGLGSNVLIVVAVSRQAGAVAP